MTALIIPNNTSYGAMTNQIVGRAVSLNTSILRLKEAIATASSGYEGTPGTEYEAAAAGNMRPSPTNNFGVQPDPDNPGAQGQAYAYAVGQLAVVWNQFWADAEPYLAQLDNGTTAF